MGLAYANLDAETRRHMQLEIEIDIKSGVLYLSPWLTDKGSSEYSGLLLDAAKSGNDDSLATALATGGRIKQKTLKKKPRSDEMMEASVPVTAPQTMAGEFNVFYIRGLCSRAIEHGIPHLEIYRAKERDEPRPESGTLVGSKIDPKATLEDLRTSQGKSPKLGFPAGPNTGLTARIP